MCSILENKDCKIIVAKSLILTLWYVILILAVLAYSCDFKKKSSKAIESSDGEMDLYSPIAILMSIYDKDKFEIPVETFIDVLNAVIPEWANASNKVQYQDSQNIKTEMLQREPYFLLYASVSNYLNSLALIEDLDEKTIKFDKTIIPKYFEEIINFKADIKFPLSAQHWLKEKQKSNAEYTSKINLIKIFSILLFLGTFGSLIFLTEDLLSDDTYNDILDFIFRPLFGMALSLALSIVAILAHALMTTASLQNIRIETMCILGLGSGLLSDTAYSYLRKRSKDALRIFKKRKSS